MATTLEKYSEVGAFAKLTNAYCLVSSGGHRDLYYEFKALLGTAIPVVKTSIGGNHNIGRLCIGNKHGLLLPHNTTDQEFHHLRNCLSDQVVVVRIEERISALANYILCTDHVALIHPDIHQETVECIYDVLGVEPFTEIALNNNLGSYCVLSNKGGLVHPDTSTLDIENLSTTTGIPLVAGTVNCGSKDIAGGLIVNDWAAFCGSQTTVTELEVIESVFKLVKESHTFDFTNRRGPHAGAQSTAVVKDIAGGMIVDDWAEFCAPQTNVTELQVIQSVFKLGEKISHI